MLPLSFSTGPVSVARPRPLLAASRRARFPPLFTRTAGPGAPPSSGPVRFGGPLGGVDPAAAPFVFRQSPERLRLALEVGEREVRQQDRAVFVNVGDQGDGGGAARALPGAGQRRLVDEVDHLVAAEAPQLVLVALAAADHARQVLERVHAVLRAPPLAVRGMVMMGMGMGTVRVVVALLLVGDQAVPAPLVARQGAAVVGTRYHVLGGPPPLEIGWDPVAGPHIRFVVGVSSCRRHLVSTQRPSL